MSSDTVSCTTALHYTLKTCNLSISARPRIFFYYLFMDKEYRLTFGFLCGNSKMRACGDADLQFRVSRVRFSVRDRVGVRVSGGVRIRTFYF